MSRKKSELNDIFDLKPQLTFAMKLAASFSITYYSMMLLYYIMALVFYRYSSHTNIATLIIGALISLSLTTSLVQILRKKTYWKAVFVIMSAALIVFQFFATSLHPWMKYAIEIFMVLIITPLRIKEKGKLGKIINTFREDNKNGHEDSENKTLDTDKTETS